LWESKIRSEQVDPLGSNEFGHVGRFGSSRVLWICDARVDYTLEESDSMVSVRRVG
jgi:hypothetical protein